MTKRYVPRWLYTEMAVPRDLANGCRVPPCTFTNDSIWPMQLEYLSFCGFPMRVAAGAGTQANRRFGGIGSRLRAEIGISGLGDINVVPGLLSAVTTHTEPIVTNNTSGQVPISRHLKYPYRLSRDDAMIATYRERGDQTWTPTDTKVGTPLPVIFYGRDVSNGRPVIFAGWNDQDFYGNTGEINFNNADLRNLGRHDVDIHRIVMVLPIQTVQSIDSEIDQCGFYQSFLFNPTTGERWMPGSVPIPIGCLAPEGVEAVQYRDTSPCVYRFPQGVYFDRRQEMSVRLWLNQDTNFIDAGDQAVQPVGVCLFGYMEVD